MVVKGGKNVRFASEGFDPTAATTGGSERSAGR